MNEPQTPQYYEDEIDLRELFAKLWASKWLILAVSLAAGLISGLYALIKPPTFEVKAMIRPAIIEIMPDGSSRYIEKPEKLIATIKSGAITPGGKQIFKIEATPVPGTDYINLSAQLTKTQRENAEAELNKWLTAINKFYAPDLKLCATSRNNRRTFINDTLKRLLDNRNMLDKRIKAGTAQDQVLLSLALEVNASNLITIENLKLAYDNSDRLQQNATPTTDAVSVITQPTCSGPLDNKAKRKIILGTFAGFFFACLLVLFRKNQSGDTA